MKERGNILFLILLAVVLFAALSYAVTNSMGGSTKDVSNEKAATLAAQIINVISLQEPELMRFMERKNLQIHQLDFTGTPGTASNMGNSSNCVTTDCDFWRADGGGVTPALLPSEAADPAATDAACLVGGNYRPTTINGNIRPLMLVISASGVGTPLSDLTLYYTCISPKVCAEINIQEGIRQRQDTVVTGNDIGTFSSHHNYFNQNSSSLPNTSANRTAGSDNRLMSRRVWCREDYSAGSGGQLFAVIYAR